MNNVGMRLIPAVVLLFLLPITAFSTDLQREKFANGVTLIVDEDHTAPVAMVQIWLKVGGRDEQPGKTGLAHVFEHMMFKGSKKLAPGAYSERIARMGGRDNAFTSTDFTAYFETVPTEHVEEVLKMEAERFAHLQLDAAEFAKEIEVIKEERRMRTEDDPNSRMFEELSAASLRLHPYRNPVIGWMQDLESLTIDDVRAFYKKHYVAANVTVVIVGDVDFSAAKKIVKRSFGALPKRKVVARFNPDEPAPLGAKRLTVTLPAKLPLVGITIPVPAWKPGENDMEAASIAVATALLAAGRSARLQHELVNEKRLAFEVGAGYDPVSMGLDLWYAYAALGPDQKPSGFEKGFWSLIESMGQEPTDDERLTAIKRNVVAGEVFARDSLYLRAKQIGRMETVGIGADQRDRWLEAINSVTAKDVQQAVKAWLRPERATTALLNPI